MLTATSYAPYWENDSVADPKLVRYISGPKHNFFEVQLPDMTVRQVHLHSLGLFHRAI